VKNTNFAEYFLEAVNKGFIKNFNNWKTTCVDYNEFKGHETPEELYLFYHPGKNICRHPECNNPTSFISVGRGFKETCCRKHSMELTSLEKYGVKYKSQLPEFRESVKKTIREKYGCDCVFQSDEIKEKTKTTNLEKYGFENAMLNKEVKEKVRKSTLENNDGIGFQTGKSKKTLMALFGVENPSQVHEFQEKKKKTFIENYGVDNPMKNEEIQNKAKKTNLENYGVENIFEDSEYMQQKFKEKYGVNNPMQIKEFAKKVSETHKRRYSNNHWMKKPEIIEKRRKTNKNKFGVDHPMQNSEIFKKNMGSCFRRKEYKWNTGEISELLGYEHIVLGELEEQGYLFNDVKTKPEEMPEIWYSFEGKQHRYYPDFYIPAENLIIEVKSDFTLQGVTNEYKFQAVKDAGFNFKLEVR